MQQPTAPMTQRTLAGITLLMGLVQLLITSDFSTISIALPTIGAKLGIDAAMLSWIISANAITFVGFMIVGGRLTDIYGHRRALLAGLALFAIGATLSAFGQNIWMLIATRSLQGLGAAVIAPASFSLIGAFLPEGPARHRALGVFGVMQGLSVILGLVVGGYVTTALGWRAVFFVNLPFVILSMALAATLLPRTRPVLQSLDIGGGLSMMAATGCLLFAVSTFGHAGFGSPSALIALLAAIALYGLFGVIESRHPKPLLPLSIFRAGDLAAACLALAALIGGVGGIFVICSMYMQNGLHFSAARSGLGMLPVALATIASGQCAPVFMKRLNQRTIALAGLGLEVAGLLLLALSSVTGRYALSVAPFAFLSIFGSSSAFMALMGLATGGLKPEQQGTGSALLFTGQQIGLPLGVAVTLAAFKAATDPSRLTALEPYRTGFLIPVGFAALSLLVTLLLVRRQKAPVEASADLSMMIGKETQR